MSKFFSNFARQKRRDFIQKTNALPDTQAVITYNIIRLKEMITVTNLAIQFGKECFTKM